MAGPEQYDARIECILSKIKAAKEKKLRNCPNLCTPPMTEAAGTKSLSGS